MMPFSIFFIAMSLSFHIIQLNFMKGQHSWIILLAFGSSAQLNSILQIGKLIDKRDIDSFLFPWNNFSWQSSA